MNIGPYEVLGELGRGGMGVVYRARHTGLQREVALKVVSGAATPDTAERFRREVQAAAGLAGHPHVVAVHDCGVHEGRLWCAMDLIEGQSLESLAASGELAPWDAARHVEDIARAVHVAHGCGLLHRDIKPANVLVGFRRGAGPGSAPESASTRAFLTDFGLALPRAAAADVTRLTGADVLLGTPAYMAPEQVLGKPLDARADVWALGATLGEALTGEPPFGTGEIFDVLHRVLSADPVGPRDRDPGVPAALDAIVRRCLEKDPAARYPTAAALADALAHARAGGAVAAPRRGRSRAWRIGAGAVAVSGVVGAVAGVAWWTERAGRTTAASGTADLDLATLAQVRATTDTALRAVLELRRAGNVEGMARLAADAEAACHAAAARLPRSPEPSWRLGRLLRARLAEREALAAQDEALRRDPGFAPARYERLVLRALELQALLTEARQGLAPPTEGDRTLALASLVARVPDGAARLAALEDDLAALEADPASAGDPGAAARLAARGLRAWARGARSAAEAPLREAIARDPDLLEAYEVLGFIAFHSGRHDEAQGMFAAGLARDAGYAPFYAGRARTVGQAVHPLLGTGRLPAADYAAILRDFGRALAGHPQDGALWRDRGMTRQWWLMGNLGSPDADAEIAAAESDLATAERLIPGDVTVAEAQVSLALAAADRARRVGADPAPLLARAGAWLDGAVARFPERGTFYRLRGLQRINAAVTRTAAGDPAEALWADALADLDLAIARSPDVADNWRLRALARLNRVAMGAQEGAAAHDALAAAAADLAEALAQMPGDPDLLLARGRLHLQRAFRAAGDRADATPAFAASLADYEAALAAAPTLDPEAWGECGGVRTELAGRREWTDGADPRPELERAIAEMDRAIRAGADGARVRAQQALARVARFRAMRDRDDPATAAAATAAREDCAALLATTDDPRVRAGLADCDAWLASNSGR